MEKAKETKVAKRPSKKVLMAEIEAMGVDKNKSTKLTPLTTLPLSTSKQGIILFFNIFILKL